MTAALTLTVSLLLLASASCFATGNEGRSAAARHAFQRSTPCPATGKPSGSCPGYIIDHIQPLCAGGADSPSNMQWQTVAEAKVKDREEIKQCRNSRAAR